MAKEREETWSGDSVLARRIWGRYASAPGVISTGSVLRLSRRIASVGRLPLLADVQRRWLPRGEAWPRGGSALLYARPAFYAEHPSSEPGVGVRSLVSMGAETPPPRARVTAPSASSAGRVVQRETSPSASTADRPPEEVRSPGRAGDDVNATAPAAAETGGLGAAIVQRHRATPVGQSVQTQVTSPRSASLSEPAELLSGQVTQEQRVDGEPANITDRPLVKLSSRPVDEQRPPAPQEVLASPAASGNLGAAIVQRYQGTPIKQVVRARIADGGLMRLSEPVGSSSGQGAQVQRAGADRVSTADHPLVERPSRLTGESGSPVAQGEPTSPSADGDLGAAIVQRYQGTPIKQVVRTRIADGGLMRLSEPVGSSSGQSVQVQRAGADRASTADHPLVERLSRLTGESGSPVAQGEPTLPSADGGGTPGAVIVQRHRDTPVGRVAQVVNPGPLESSSGQGAQVRRVGTEVKFAMSAGSEMARAKPVTPVADGGDLGAALVQRHLSGPASRVLQTRLAVSGMVGDHPPVELSPSRLDVASGPPAARAGPTTPTAIGDLGATLLQRHLGGPVGRARERQVFTAAPGSTRAARQEVAELQRSSPALEPRFSTSNVRQGAASAPVFGGGTVEPPPGIALGWAEMPLARAAGGIQRSGGDSLPPVQTRLAGPGAWATVVQRDAADTTAASEAGAPASEPSPPTETPSGAEGPDLERLADEVYAIIERRLIIERESRGL